MRTECHEDIVDQDEYLRQLLEVRESEQVVNLRRINLTKKKKGVKYELHC